MRSLRTILIAALVGALFGCTPQKVLQDPPPRYVDAQSAWVAGLRIGQPIDETLAALPERMYASTGFDVREAGRDHQYRDVWGAETFAHFGLYFEDGKLATVLQKADDRQLYECRLELALREPTWLVDGFEPYRAWILAHGRKPEELDGRAFEPSLGYRSEAQAKLAQDMDNAAYAIGYSPFIIIALPFFAIDQLMHGSATQRAEVEERLKSEQRWQAFKQLQLGTLESEALAALGQPTHAFKSNDDETWSYGSAMFRVGVKNSSVYWKEWPSIVNSDVAHGAPEPSAACAAFAKQDAAGRELASYTVTVDPALDRAWVEVRSTTAARSLVPSIATAEARLDPTTLRGATITFDHDELWIAPGDVATYHAAIRPLARRLTRASDPGLVLSDPRDWLWLPKGFGGNDWVRISFVLPPKVGVATPWPADGAALIVRPYMLDEQGLVGIGRMAQREIPLGGATVRLSVAGGDGDASARLGTWAEGVWRRARGTVAAPPGSIEQLMIVPVDDAHEAVPWGEVRRGAGNSVLAIVARAPDPAELREDWTLYHELSHLYLPWLGEDRWLSEGFASYYQNVLRARDGVISPEMAWQRLAEGLARGAAEAKAKPGRTVEEGSRMVTYWTGAALALEWDIALRKASGGKDSLDALLARFAAANLPAIEAWTAMRFAGALDAQALTGPMPGTMPKQYFADSMARFVALRGFPDYSGSFAAAGVDPSTGKARLDAPAELLAIMQPAQR